MTGVALLLTAALAQPVGAAAGCSAPEVLDHVEAGAIAAGALFKEGRFEASLERFRALDAVLRAAPDCGAYRARVLVNAARCLEALDRYDEALATYAESLPGLPPELRGQV